MNIRIIIIYIYLSFILNNIFKKTYKIFYLKDKKFFSICSMGRDPMGGVPLYKLIQKKGKNNINKV